MGLYFSTTKFPTITTTGTQRAIHKRHKLIPLTWTFHLTKYVAYRAVSPMNVHLVLKM